MKMYELLMISCSMHQHHRNAGIIHVKDIVQPCHLVPKIGAEVELWMSDSVYELARTLFVNDFINLDFFFPLFRRSVLMHYIQYICYGQH